MERKRFTAIVDGVAYIKNIDGTIMSGDVIDHLADIEDIMFTADGKELVTVEHLTELVNAEQKRREGCDNCKRNTCPTCRWFGWHPKICKACESQRQYSAVSFCPHCGRDLRGESHDGD